MMRPLMRKLLPSPRSRFLLALSTAALLWSCAGSRNEQEEVRTFLASSASFYVQKGSGALRDGRLDEALEAFRQARALTPADAVVRNNVGVAFYRIGLLDSAVHSYQAALALRPDYSQALTNLAKAELAAGRFEQALDAAGREAALQPAVPDGHALQAEIHEARGDYPAAILANRAALDLAPADAGLRNNLGVLYFRSGRTDQAIAEYQQVLQQDSTHAVACFNLGNALARKCLLPEALYQYDRALTFQPDMTPARNNHGLIRLFLGRPEEALKDFRMALAVDSNAAMVHYNLSIAQIELDSTMAARKSVERAIRLDARVPNFHLQLSRVLEAQGDDDGAMTALNRALALDSTLASAHNSLANLVARRDPLAATGVYRKALSLYPDYLQKRYLNTGRQIERGFVDLLASCKEAVQITTDYAMVHNNLGKVYLQLGQYEEAAKAFARAAEVQPDLWEPYENLAVVRFAQKKNDAGRELVARGRVQRARAALNSDSLAQAESLCRSSIQLYPGHPAAYALLAQVLLRREQPVEAEAALRKGLERGAQDADIHFAYGKFLALRGRPREAEKFLQRAVQLDPRLPETRRMLADVLRTQGRDDEAFIQWAESHAALGREYQAAGFLDRALDEYRIAATLTPKNADYLAMQGVVYTRLADHQAADSLFTLALTRDPQNHRALYAAGILKGDHKQYGDAIGYLLRALEVNPEDGATHYALAVNYYFLNDFERARRHVEKAVQLGADIRSSFIQALFRAGPPR